MSKTPDQKAQECVQAFKPLADAATAVLEKMKKPEDGGAAFPVDVIRQTYNTRGELRSTQWGKSQVGMSLRDYFAARAMTAIYSHSVTLGVDQDSIASEAYEIADAMIAARKA